MSDIQIFRNEKFGEIRVTVSENNEPIFCAKDIATALGYADTADAISRHCKSSKKVFHPHANGVGGVNVVYIPEKDVYRLIMRSNLPEAEKFQDWVCDEVLPSIRKTGGYLVVSDSDTEAEILARAVLVAQDTLKRREQRIAQLENDNKALVAINHEQAEAISEMKPKVNYCDIILASPTTVLVTEIAQDYGMSARKLNKILHTMGIQHKVGRSWVLYAKYLTEGYVQSYTEPNKNSHFGGTFTYSKWTQKGRIFLYHELKQRGVLPLIEQS